MVTKTPSKSGSDRQLLALRFRVIDPVGSLPNLTTTRPDSDIQPKIVGYYDEKPLGARMSNPDIPYLWCCHCQKRTHWRGYVLENATGFSFMIGNDCGRDHYGAEFELVEKAFRDQQRRQQSLKSYLNLVQKIAGLDLEITEVLSCPVLKEHDKRSAEFSKAAPRAFKALRTAAKRGVLQAVQRVRDYEAETTRDERYKRAYEHFRSRTYSERKILEADGLKPEKEEGPIYVDEPASFGGIVGSSIFGLNPARKQALACRNALQQFNEIEIQGTEQFTSQEIAKRTKSLVDLCRQLNESLRETRKSAEFFNADQISRICQWAECFRQFSCEPLDGDLRVRDVNSHAHQFRQFKLEGFVSSPIIAGL